MKNVIAFALWGDLPMYIYGIFQNIKLAQRFYPDWVCRFYIDKDCPKKIKDRIIEFGAEVRVLSEDWKRAKYFWRLKVILDRYVDKFMIRDVDSRIGLRESIAIEAWLKSGKACHIMRDHKRHTMNIMGGMFAGIRKDFADITGFKNKFEKYIDKINSGWEPNRQMAKKLSCQDFLESKIYPEIKENALVHTSVNNRAETDLPFPKDCPAGGIDFVGQIYNEKNQPQCKV